MRERDNHLFVCNQVFDFKRLDGIRNFRAAFITVGVLQFRQFRAENVGD